MNPDGHGVRPNRGETTRIPTVEVSTRSEPVAAIAATAYVFMLCDGNVVCVGTEDGGAKTGMSMDVGPSGGVIQGVAEPLRTWEVCFWTAR